MTTTVLIDPTVANDAVGGRVNRFAVKVNNNTLYVFFGTANGAAANDYAYRKSTDGGATWSAEVNCGGPVGHLSSYHDNYYNRWNDPAATNIVHLFRIEALGAQAAYGGYYRQLNLDTDTLSAETKVFTLGIPGAGVGGVGVAQSGRIYTCGAGQGSNRMSYSDDNGVTWHALSVSFCETFNADELHMWPDYSSSDPNDIMCIYFDWSASEASVKQYDASANTITETLISGGIGRPNPVGAGWRNTASAMATADHHIRVAAYDQYSNPQTLYTWDVAGSSATARSNVLTAMNYARAVGLSIMPDDSTYVFYGRDPSAASFSNGYIYYRHSYDGMVTWGPEGQYGTRRGGYSALHSDPQQLAGNTTTGMAWRDGNELFIEVPLVGPTVLPLHVPVAINVRRAPGVVDIHVPVAINVRVIQPQRAFLCIDLDGASILRGAVTC